MAPRLHAIGLVALLALVSVTVTTPVFAQANPTSEDEDRWRFRRYDWLDATLTGVGGAVAIGATFVWPPKGTVRWEGGNGFDDAVRDLLRAESRGGRDRARLVGDIAYITGGLYPAVVDGIVLSAVRGRPATTTHMLLIDLEAYAVAGGFLIGTERLFGRARPSVAECETDPEYEAFCGERDRAASMISGHTGIVSTSAGLLCVHHQHLDIYGSPAADTAACIFGIGLAATTGIARIVNDRHYATDVLAAFVVGGSAGYLLPLFRFYRTGPETPRDVAFTIVPAIGRTSAGLALAGIL